MPKTALLKKRAEKAFKDLLRWQRKLKLATAKVDHYLKRVVYYKRFLAAARKEIKERKVAHRALQLTD